tara:strand:- start:51664 stop:51993 length:330 start_codon:yes stop_codon:yes gene_type:complete
MNLHSIFQAKDSRVRLAKAIVLGFLMALVVGWLTSVTTYLRGGKQTNESTYVISEAIYNNYSERQQIRFIKSTDYNELFIIIAFLSGTAIGYLIISQNQNNSSDLTKWN